jgi:Carboxypeptidase regulatory-like domain
MQVNSILRNVDGSERANLYSDQCSVIRQLLEESIRILGPLFLVPVLFVAAHPRAVAADKEKCAIEGTVVGLPNSTSLANAEVTLHRKDEITGPTVAVTTDASGHYAVEDIEPGSYLITAERNGYVPQTYGQHRRKREGMTLILEPGMKLHGIDFRLLRTGVILGKVSDENGEPVTGAEVQALTPRYVDGERGLIAGAAPVRTNDLGEYRIYGLAPDRYYVGVSGQDPDRATITRPKGAPREERYLPTLYPSVGEIDRAWPVELPPGGEVLGIDIVILKSRIFHIRGRIADFRPVDQHARVQLDAVGVGWEIKGRGADMAIGAQGSFDFSGVTPGSYVISTAFVQGRAFLRATRLLRVQDADLGDVSLVLGEGVLRGRVRVEGASSRIDFRKLGVRLADPYSLPVQAIMASDGSFAFHGVGHYRYRVGISGAEKLYVKSVRLGDQEVTNRVIDLTAAEEPASILEIVLGADGARIDGLVTTDDGKPAADAVVVLIPDTSRRRDSGLFKDSTTNQNGQFEISGIAPGNYMIFAWDDIERGIWWDREFLSRYEEKGEEITVEANSHQSPSIHLISVGAQ